MYFEVLIHIIKMPVPIGTKIQALAWTHASSSVTDYVTRAVTTLENQCHMIQPAFRCPLSLTGAVALDHRLGLENAAIFFFLVYPWQYPAATTKASIATTRFSQSAVAKTAFPLFSSGSVVRVSQTFPP